MKITLTAEEIETILKKQGLIPQKLRIRGLSRRHSVEGGIVIYLSEADD